MKSVNTFSLDLGLDVDRLVIRANQSKRSKLIRYSFYITDRNQNILLKLTDSGKVDVYLYILKGLFQSFNKAFKQMNLTGKLFEECKSQLYKDYDKVIEILEKEPCIKNLSKDFIDFWSTYIIDIEFNLIDLINMRTLGYEYGEYFFYTLSRTDSERFIGSKDKNEMNLTLQELYNKASKDSELLSNLTDFNNLNIGDCDIDEICNSINNKALSIYTGYFASLSGIIFNYNVKGLTDFKTPLKDLDFKNVKFSSNIFLTNKVGKVFAYVAIVSENNQINITMNLTDKNSVRTLYLITVTDTVNTWISSTFNKNLRDKVDKQVIINPIVLCNIVCYIYNAFYSRRKKYTYESTSNFIQPEVEKTTSDLTASPITITVRRKDLNVEDMSLTEFKENIGTKHLNHKSPIPHYRSPHTRISKNGVVSEIKGTVVNKSKLNNDDFINYIVKD